MNDATDPVQIVQTNQNLLGQSPAQMHGDALELVSSHYLIKIRAKHFEHETEMASVRSIVNKAVE